MHVVPLGETTDKSVVASAALTQSCFSTLVKLILDTIFSVKMSPSDVKVVLQCCMKTPQNVTVDVNERRFLLFTCFVATFVEVLLSFV